MASFLAKGRLMILSPFVDEQKRTRYYVLNCDGWDQFEQLVKHVERSLHGTVTEHVDGPDARVWTVSVKNHPITFTHNDILGNCFFSQEENASHVLQEVVQVVQNAKL